MDEMHQKFLINWGSDITLKEIREYMPEKAYKKLLKHLDKDPTYFRKFSTLGRLVKYTTFQDLVFCVVVNDIKGFKCCKNLLGEDLNGRKQLADVYEELFRLSRLELEGK